MGSWLVGSDVTGPTPLVGILTGNNELRTRNCGNHASAHCLVDSRRRVRVLSDPGLARICRHGRAPSSCRLPIVDPPLADRTSLFPKTVARSVPVFIHQDGPCVEI